MTRYRALHFLLGQHICFSEHGRAPRWKLRIALASFAFGKLGNSHGFAIYPFSLVLFKDTTAFTGLATMLRREIHHRLRTNHFHVR